MTSFLRANTVGSRHMPEVLTNEIEKYSKCIVNYLKHFEDSMSASTALAKRYHYCLSSVVA